MPAETEEYHLRFPWWRVLGIAAVIATVETGEVYGIASAGFERPGLANAGTQVLIPKGSGASRIIRLLEAAGLINVLVERVVWLVATRLYQPLQASEY